MIGHENKTLINDICEWKKNHPKMSFLKICEKVGMNDDHKLLTTSAEVFESLFSGKDNASNLIINTVIKLKIDNEMDSYESLYREIFNQPNIIYNGLNLFALMGTLDEINDIDFFVGELTTVGFEVTIGGDSVLLKMLKNYQNRKHLAKNDSLSVDDEFYSSYIG